MLPSTSLLLCMGFAPLTTLSVAGFFLRKSIAKKYSFDNLKAIDAETANTERYLQSLDGGRESEDAIESQLHFLRWLISNVALRNDSILIKLANYVRRMVMITVSDVVPYRFRRTNDIFFGSLENPDRLQDLEKFLNEMGIECKLVLKKSRMDRENYIFHMKSWCHFIKMHQAVPWRWLTYIAGFY